MDVEKKRRPLPLKGNDLLKNNNIQKIDLFEIGNLKFEKPNFNKFKCLKLAYKALEMGHCYQVILNATNEVLVDEFLNGKIKYTQIADGIEEMMNIYENEELETVEDILKFDQKVKEDCKEILLKKGLEA